MHKSKKAIEKSLKIISGHLIPTFLELSVSSFWILYLFNWYTLGTFYFGIAAYLYFKIPHEKVNLKLITYRKE